jgi:molybdopterin converting factor subunit 1
MVRIMLFAQYREIVDSDAIQVEVKGAGQLTVGELRKLIGYQHPALSAYINSALIAVNEEIATNTIRLVEGDVIAAMPPVSGGT